MFSSDGFNWTEPVSIPIPDELIGEQAMISYDEGESWTQPFYIDKDAENADLGYPCSVELDDGKIMTIYYQHDNKGDKNSIMCTIWDLPEKN